MSTPVPLLDAIVRDALDPSYAQAAQRRRARAESDPAGRTRTRRQPALVGAVLLVIAGVLAGLAVSSQHKTIPQVGAARTALAGDAGALTRQVKSLEVTLAAGQRQVAALQQQQLRASAQGQQLQQQQAALSAAAAQTAVRGPGVTVIVSDVNSQREGTAGSRPQTGIAGGTGLVADRDLQSVVNALWAGGAEAISVGGIRLGPLTTIRTAGQTILVDFRPLSSPYRIDAIGGPQLLGAVNQSPAVANLRAGPAGTHPDVVTQAASLLTLPAASSAQSHAGQPLPTGGHS